jgi:hypothetical protein
MGLKVREKPIACGKPARPGGIFFIEDFEQTRLLTVMGINTVNVCCWIPSRIACRQGSNIGATSTLWQLQVSSRKVRLAPYPCNLNWPILMVTDTSLSLAVIAVTNSIKDWDPWRTVVDLLKQSAMCRMSSGLLKRESYSVPMT